MALPQANDVQQALLREYGIRVQPHMAGYVLNRLRAGAGGAIFGTLPVIGGDARTGVPLRTDIALDRINAAIASSTASSARLRETSAE